MSAPHAVAVGVCVVSLWSAHAQPEAQRLPGLTLESLGELPALSGWWEYRGELPSAILALDPPPLSPQGLAALRAGRENPDADPDPLRFCRPPQFVGSSGGVAANLEVLFTPGRVTLANEAGLIRRIYTDGRALPDDPDLSNTGTSIGVWEAGTLVVRTVGIDPSAKFPDGAPGGLPIGDNVTITERISLAGSDTLLFDVTIEAPELLTGPYRRVLPFARSEQAAARELSACTSFDRAIDPVTGTQRFDTTPPPDLPPPPSQRR